MPCTSRGNDEKMLDLGFLDKWAVKSRNSEYALYDPSMSMRRISHAHIVQCWECESAGNYALWIRSNWDEVDIYVCSGDAYVVLRTPDLKV